MRTEAIARRSGRGRSSGSHAERVATLDAVRVVGHGVPFDQGAAAWRARSLYLAAVEAGGGQHHSLRGGRRDNRWFRLAAETRLISSARQHGATGVFNAFPVPRTPNAAVSLYAADTGNFSINLAASKAPTAEFGNAVSPHKQGSFDFPRTRLAFFRDLPD
jgi:hypothetical protein